MTPVLPFGMKPKQVSAYRLTDMARKLVAKLAKLHGMNRTAVVETAIREMAARDGVK